MTTAGVMRWYSFNITALVKEWVDGTLPNNGVLLRGDYTPFTFFFASNEYSQPDKWPRLVIRYH